MTATLDDEVADLRRANAELQRKLDERTSERDETEAQKAAMAEVLEVINSSPGDLAPVFDGMLEKAMRLCGAAFGFMTVIDGERSRTVAARGVTATPSRHSSRNRCLPAWEQPARCSKDRTREVARAYNEISWIIEFA